MEKIKSLADLKKIRDNVQSKIDLREKSEHPENLIQIKVAMATCGIAAGSKETMNYFKAEEIIQKYLKNDELVEGIIPVNYQSI